MGQWDRSGSAESTVSWLRSRPRRNEKSDLDLVVASTSKAVVMIEGFGEELTEAEMAEAIMEAAPVQPRID